MLGAGLAALAGLSVGRAVLVTAVVFTGQLSIGWSNDYLDAERDRAVHRSDKPVAAGAVEPRLVRTAAVVALILTLALSAVLGVEPGGSSAHSCAAVFRVVRFMFIEALEDLGLPYLSLIHI